MKRLVLAWAVLLALATSLVAWDTRPSPVLPDGTRVACDLPSSEHMMNVGGSDGAGLCVYTSVTLSAKWQNLKEVYSLRKFAEGRPGGSYPEKLAEDLKVYAKRYNVQIPAYLQHTGGDDALLDLAIATRRMPGITYAGMDDFYDSPILHMVNLVHLDEKNGAIQDNNRAGKWTSDTRRRILYRWKGLDDDGRDLLVPVREGLRTLWIPAGGGWAFIWLGAPPPPIAPETRAKAQEYAKKCEHCGAWERTIDEDKAAWLYWVNGELKYKLIDGRWFDGSGTVVDEPAGLAPPTAEPTDDWNKGVSPSGFDRRNRYWINGVEVSAAKAYAAVSAPQPDDLVDDSDKYHLSFVGSDAKTVASWFAVGGQFEKYAKRVHVQVYAETDWAAKERLKAAITLQEPAKRGGKVAASGTDAAKVLSDVFDVPEPVMPQPRKPDPVPSPVVPVSKTPWALIAVLVGGILLFFLTRKG